jgi:hypothetical protein
MYTERKARKAYVTKKNGGPIVLQGRQYFYG